MATVRNARPVLNYLGMQAYVGITKHNGGFEATDELLSLCHIEDAQRFGSRSRLPRLSRGRAPESARQSLKDIFGMPLDVVQQMGYGLFAGRK